jgi:hypothetical protein
MVISIALMGFAASASVLAFIQSKAGDPLPEKSFSFLLSVTAFLLSIFTIASFWLAQIIPFSPFQLVWQKRQFLYLIGFYVIFFIPFFLAGCFIGLNFIWFKRKIARVYFFNLLGSGAGVIAAFLSFYIIPPNLLCAVPSLFAFLSLLFVALKKNTPRFPVIITLFGASILSIYLINGGTPLKISQYKDIRKTLQLPEARIEYVRYSPLGLVQVVDAPSMRYAAGLSLTYGEGPPPQKGLFVDGNSYGAVTNFAADKGALRYLDYTTYALPYHLFSPRQVLVLNAGGGSHVLGALYHTADHITAVEPHPEVINLLRGPLRSFSQNIYCNHHHIEIHTGSPREFIARELNSYDLIQLDLIGTWGGVGGGIYATGENYAYTREAFETYYARLKPQGILSASTWLNSPPRAFLKLLALALDTAEGRSGRERSRSIMAIRSWANGTVLVKKGEFSISEVQNLKKFCTERAFDLVYYPGIEQSEVNHYHVLETPVYYETVRNFLTQDKLEQRYAHCLFHIQPPTDDKPYFDHFFRLSALPSLLKVLGREWVTFLEWGYMVLWGILAQALILAPVFVALPLLFMRNVKQNAPRKRPTLFFYFGSLGLAFMFIEMGCIQKFVLVLTYPIFALALVLFTLMFFSGIGSLLSTTVAKISKVIPFVAIIVISITYIIFLDDLLKIFFPCSLPVKCIYAVLLLAPLGLFMGMPFPVGLQMVSDTQAGHIPWAWGVNGVASVIAPVLGSLLSVSFGFRMVMIISVSLYGAAGFMLHCKFPLRRS